MIAQNIDPTKWFYFNSPVARCAAQGGVCFTAGDFFRPAMDIFTAASAPIITGSANINDLTQEFIHDPQTSALSTIPQFVPQIEPRRNGDNISARAVLTPEHLKHIALKHNVFVVSSMTQAALGKAGLIK